MPQPFGPSALRTTRVLTPPVASAMPTPRLPHQPPTAAAPHRGSRTSETRFRPAYATGAKALDLDANPRRGTARYGSCLPHRPNSCERRRKNPGATHAPVPLVLGCGRPVRSLPTICPCSNRRGPCDRCRVLPEPKPLVGNPSPRAPSHPFKYAGLTRHKLCRQHRSGAGVWPQIQDIPPELVAWRAISVLGPLWQGSCAGIAGASTLCAGRFPNPTDLPPWPEPETGRSAGTNTDPPCDAPPPPHAPDHPSAVAHSDRPSAAGTPEAKPPCSATVSRGQRPACSSSTQHLCFNPWREYPVAQPASIPVGGPCFTLACLTQRRQAAAVHALP